ncbi:MAG: DUF1289 domain-containing protein [Gammaproteobacteria bacterium]|nr:MAG: DUF1289 domain-containing protein [Gammaproteobacteria bacterium]
MSKSVKTPCIGVCSTVFGDEVCRGCKRFQHEIIKWNAYDDIEKRSVLNRLELLKVQIMQSKVMIIDEDLLRSKLHDYKIKFDEDSDSLCWVFDLLRSGSQSIADPSEFGFDLINSSVLNLSELKKVMEEELFQLSEAHYQRYFKTETFFNA